MTELPGSEGAPLRRELVRLWRAARLFWLLFAVGILFVLLAVIPELARPAPVFAGFGLGLILAAFLLRNSQIRCPRCSEYLRSPVLPNCPNCRASLSKGGGEGETEVPETEVPGDWKS